MQYAVDSNEMKAYDSDTIQKIGIPSMVLMERAALATVEVIMQCYPKLSNVLVVAGTGNNGGDGLAVARLLGLREIPVTIMIAGQEEKLSAETKQQATILRNLGFSFSENVFEQKYDLIVDALFGIGLSREITGEYAAIINQMNLARDHGAKICAIDIPSGISADNGQVMGTAVYADITATFAFAKKGHLLYSGKEHTGQLFIKDIGITNHAFTEISAPKAFFIEKQDIKELLPKRKPDGNKGTFGKVLLFAGSYDMSGASILCGNSILRTGAGMLKIITPNCNREIIQNSFPEAMLMTYSEMPNKEELRSSLEWADVVVAGPGISTNKSAYEILNYLLEHASQKMILDADALNLVAVHEELMHLAAKQDNLVITPHPGEFIRLAHIRMEDYQSNKEKEISELAKKLNCTVVAKDTVTLVFEQTVNQYYMNTSGNDGMATAGSGDVLTGIIGGLLAQGLKPFEAAYLGVYLHGLCGMEASAKTGKYGVIASDLINELCLVMNQNE